MMMYARAHEFLLDSLAAGPRSPSEVIAEAERIGIEYSAVLLAARSLAEGDVLWRLRPTAEARITSQSAEAE